MNRVKRPTITYVINDHKESSRRLEKVYELIFNKVMGYQVNTNENSHITKLTKQ